jgi:arylsulfatase
VGRLLAKVKEWGLERDTLVIFMNDNGGTAGVRVFNAGMRGQKGTPYQGGTRGACFFHWEGKFKPADVKALSAHIDIFPTLAELSGAKIPPSVKLDGRSLAPMLKNPNVAMPDRYLFTHVTRWEQGKAAESKYAKCRVRNTRFSMVNMGKGWELYDLTNDPGESKDVKDKFPADAKKLSDAYDKFWDESFPLLENENAIPPAVPPYIELYRKQFGGKV